MTNTVERTPRHFLNVGQAAEYLGVSAASLRNWSDQGKVPVYRTPAASVATGSQTSTSSSSRGARRPSPRRLSKHSARPASRLLRVLPDQALQLLDLAAHAVLARARRCRRRQCADTAANAATAPAASSSTRQQDAAGAVLALRRPPPLRGPRRCAARLAFARGDRRDHRRIARAARTRCAAAPGWPRCRPRRSRAASRIVASVSSPRAPAVTASRHLERGRVPVLEVDVEREPDCAVQRIRDLGPHRSDRLHLVVLLLQSKLGERAVLVRQAAGKELVRADAERVDVGRRPRLLAAGLLRGEVCGGPEHRPDLGDARLLSRLRDSEVGELDRAGLASRRAGSPA